MQIVYVIWMLISAAVLSKGMESKKYEWLQFPSTVSLVVSTMYWIFDVFAGI